MSSGARGRLLLHRYGVYAAAILVVLALAAGGLAVVTYGDVPTETVVEETDVERFAVESHTEATVDGSNITLYSPGERLVDMPVYFHEESPRMDLILSVAGPSGTDIDIRVTAELEATRDDRTFYEETIVIAADQQTLETGDAELIAPVDVPRIIDRVDQVSERTVGVGSLDRTISVVVEYESERYAGTLEDEVEIVLTGQGYWLDVNPADDRRHSETITHEVELDRDRTSLLTYGGVALVLLVLGIALGSYSMREIDTEALETAIARSEFDEWISSGEIPTRASKQYVKVASLEDVVDIAIDSNKRVIHDPNLDAFGVIDGDLVYYFAPGADEIEEWLEL